MKKLLKKQISKLVSILVLTLSTTSCNYLDVIPDNIPTIDMAFADRAAAEKYLFTCYSYLPNFYHPDNDPAMLGSGEIVTMNALREGIEARGKNHLKS